MSHFTQPVKIDDPAAWIKMHAASAISENDFEDIVDNLKEARKISKEQQRQWKKDFSYAR